MVGKMSIQAQQTIEFFNELKVKLDRLHSLVEQFAAAKSMPDQYLGPLNRTAVDVNRLLMNKGYGIMADTANQIAMLAKRGGSGSTKTRGFREMLSSLRAGIETNVKIIIAEEAHKDEDKKSDA